VKKTRLVSKMRVANISLVVFRRQFSRHLNTSTFSIINVFKRLGGTFKQSLLAFVVNVFGLVAGALVALHFGLFSREPWVILLYPAILSSRGVIGGLLCGRLSTGLHLGLIQPSFFGNTKHFRLLVEILLVLTFVTSISTGLLAFLFGFLFWAVSTTELTAILLIIIATMALSILLVSPLTIVVSFVSFKKGLDPDIVLYPVQSTTADILVTFCYIITLTLFFSHEGFGLFFLGMVCAMLTLLTLYFSFKNRSEEAFIRTVREAISTLVIVSFIVNMAGSFLGRVNQIIGNTPEVYVVYPALIDTIGDVGAVVGSTATTKLALGTLNPSISSIKLHTTEIFGAWSASFIMFFLYALLPLTIQGNSSIQRFLFLLSVLLVTNVIAVFSMVFISYAVGVVTFQKGLDPDNFVIPIESSLADAMTTLALLIALTFIG
jgi:mgtE-like transporter